MARRYQNLTVDGLNDDWMNVKRVTPLLQFGEFLESGDDAIERFLPVDGDDLALDVFEAGSLFEEADDMLPVDVAMSWSEMLV